MLDPDRRHLIAYAAAAAVLVVIGLQFLGSQSARAPAPAISMAAPPAATHNAAPRAPARSIWIDVAGAVRRPGLYELPAGSRAAAAIERAGGPLRRAELAAVNQAAKLADGQQIVVPVRGDAPVASGSAPAGATSSGATSAGAASAGATSAGATSSGAAAASGSGSKVSLGSATQAQLEQLDGIGPALAGRIIAYRQAHGGFRSVDELQEVEGIGDKRFRALRSSVQP